MTYLFLSIILLELRHELMSVFCMSLFILNFLSWLMGVNNKKR